MFGRHSYAIPTRLLGNRVVSVGMHSWSAGRSSGRPRGRLNQLARRHPILLFGFPFCSLMVAGSFLLTELTQTRYDLRARTVSKVNQETRLRIESGKRALSLQEEYWRLTQEDDEADAWEVARIERPADEPQ